MKFAALLVMAAPCTGMADGMPQVLPLPDSIRQEIRIPAVPSRAVELDWMLDHDALFSATREDFEKQFAQGSFTWLDKEKSRARFNPDRTDLKLRGEACGETIVSFKENRISGVMLSVLNKGDDGFIREAPFRKAVESARATLRKVSGVAESPRRKTETISKAEGYVWSTKRAMFMLEYIWVPGTADSYPHGEFVRIRVLPPQVLLGAQQNTVKTNISRPMLAKRVKREGSKVWLDGIPMVDQGSKGYCAVASFERVLRYYGSEVDMHDLAEVADSSGLGTTPGGMKDALHKMAVRSGLRTREPIFMEGKQYVSMLNAYNRVAKKAAVDPVEFPVGLVELYREMDPALFRDMRRKDPGFTKFANEVARSIDAGIPLMWALQLGMFWEERLEDSYEANRSGKKPDAAAGPEGSPPAAAARPARPPEYMAGGHMRLIIGYDAKAQVIYYTDSWGPGHEMKKMDLAEAWAVTMGLFILEP